MAGAWSDERHGSNDGRADGRAHGSRSYGWSPRLRHGPPTRRLWHGWATWWRDGRTTRWDGRTTWSAAGWIWYGRTAGRNGCAPWSTWGAAPSSTSRTSYSTPPQCQWKRKWPWPSRARSRRIEDIGVVFADCFWLAAMLFPRSVGNSRAVGSNDSRAQGRKWRRPCQGACGRALALTPHFFVE